MDAYVHLPSWHRWQAISRRWKSGIPPCPAHGACPQHEFGTGDGPVHDQYVSDDEPIADQSWTTGAGTEAGAGTGTGTGTGADTGPGPSGAAPPRARSSTAQGSVPPERFVEFHGYLAGLKGYAPNRPFWDWLEQHADELDLVAEASKILDFLRRHPDRNCSTSFLQRWLNRSIADLKATRVNGEVVASRQNGLAAAPRRGSFHRTSGTYHEDWDVCPADEGRPEAV
jgi:hypothetical protein